MLFAGIKLYLTPTTHINIDINPSLDLGINVFNKVVSVEPLNDGGKKLAESLALKFEDYDEALRRIFDDKTVEAMLSADEIMTVTVVETNNAQSADILSNVKAHADEHGGIYCHSASAEDAAAARELGLSCERYKAYVLLRGENFDITPEELNAMSMREIHELTGSRHDEEHSGGHHEENSLPTSGTHHGNGHH